MTGLKHHLQTYLSAVLCSVLPLALPAMLMAQAPPASQHFTAKDGLSHRWVFDVMQDSRGFMWISTYAGLNRYDGNQFKAYYPSRNSDSSFYADRIRWTEETSSGIFLVSTERGLFRFDPRSESFTPVDLTKQGNPSLFLLSDAKKWIAQYPSGQPVSHLDLYREQEGAFIHWKTLKKPVNHSMMLVQYSDRHLWFWSGAGTYYRLDLQNWDWEAFTLTECVNDKLPLDRQGRFWYPKAGETQLKSVKLPTAISLQDWSSFHFDEGNIWLFKHGPVQQIFRLDTRTGLLEEAVAASDLDVDDDINQFQAKAVFVDRENNLWLGDFLGMVKVRRGRKLFQNFLNAPFPAGGVPPVAVSAREMAEDGQGNIILRAQNGRLYRYDPSRGNAVEIKLAPHDPLTGRSVPLKRSVVHLQKDSSGVLWLLTRSPRVSSLVEYRPATEVSTSFTLPKTFQSPRFIYLDRRNRVLIGNSRDILKFDRTTGRFTPLGQMPSGYPHYIEPGSGIHWSVYDLGLIRTDLEKEVSEQIPLYTRPRDQRCLTLSNGFFWIGTSRGLVRVDPLTWNTKTYDRTHGLPGDFVYSMLPEGDHLWLGTSDGLCRFNVQNGAVKNFSLQDGLPHFEFNAYSTLKGSDGRFYMGTLNGVTSFQPDELSGGGNRQPTMLWSEFSFYDDRTDSLHFLPQGQLDNSRPLILPPSVRNFTFYLALDSYSQPEKNQYAWRMEDLDKDWNYVGNQPFAVYNQLPPGEYTFRAKAADPFGNWSRNELAVPVRILRPWYSRWWAIFIYFVLAVLAAFTFYRFQLGRQLAQAENRRLRELDEFKSRFFANITHEFRTPLTVIMGMSERLSADEQVPVPAKKKIGLIRRNGENLLRLINQILDLAKLENNSLQMTYVQGDVLTYLRYITESLHSLANAKNVLIRLETSEAAIVMDYDQDRLLYIIHNLLSNAIKFTPSGGKVTLRAALVPAGGGKQALKLQVQDTGTGIAPEDLPKIFDRFYQAKNAAKASTGGTGIGLSLTRELALAMDGEISVESQVDQGTIFTVLLPVRRQAEPASPVRPLKGTVPAAVPAPKKPPAAKAEKRPTLLIIEDNPDVVEYLAGCLEEDYQITYAYNGRSGIEQAIEGVPDIVISDVMMPEKDGFEVVESLKNEDRTSHIPIVLLTAKVEVESRLAGLRRGADAYLAKPFHQEELRLTLRQLLENRRRLQERYSRLPLEASSLSGTPGQEQEDAFVLRLKSFYEENLSNSALTQEDVCREMGMGRTNLNRKLQALTGKSAMQLLRQMRLHRARLLLSQANQNVSEVAFAVGFNDPKYFSRAFAREFGFPPSQAD